VTSGPQIACSTVVGSRVSDVGAPACRAPGERRYIGEYVRRRVVKQGISESHGLGYLGLGFRLRRAPLNISMDADGLQPGFRSGGVNIRDATEADRIETVGADEELGWDWKHWCCIACCEKYAGVLFRGRGK